MVHILSRYGKHVMLVGDRGSAKSLLVHHYLSGRSSDDAHFCSKTIVFSSATTSATLQVRVSTLLQCPLLKLYTSF